MEEHQTWNSECEGSVASIKRPHPLLIIYAYGASMSDYTCHPNILYLLYYYCFFHEATAILTGAIIMIQTQRSCICSGVLYPHHSILKQIKLFGSVSQALEASTCLCTPFCSIPFCVTVVTPTPETQTPARAVLLRRV